MIKQDTIAEVIHILIQKARNNIENKNIFKK